MTTKKACIACGSEIPAVAKLCKECSTYQVGLQRHFAISSTVLALVLAIISVVGALGPQIKELIVTKDSSLSGEFLSLRNGRAVFQISNTGNRAGSITGGFLVVTTGPGTSTTSFPLSLGSDDQSIIRPDEVKVVNLHSDSMETGLVQLAYANSSSEKCSLRLVGKNFLGTQVQFQKTDWCVQIVNALFPGVSQAIIRAKPR